MKLDFDTRAILEAAEMDAADNKQFRQHDLAFRTSIQSAICRLKNGLSNGENLDFVLETIAYLEAALRSAQPQQSPLPKMAACGF